MRSKYCFRPEDLSSAVFWFDSVYPRAITEHPEDLFTLYVMRVQKRKVGEPSGSSGGRNVNKKQLKRLDFVNKLGVEKRSIWGIE